MTDRTFSYQPGGWFGIVGKNAAVLLPGTEKARAGALWALVDDGAGFDAVLDALVAGGLSSLPGFVLLASEGGTTRVVVRGDASASFESAEGTVRLTGSGGSMWVERVLHEVTELSISLPGELSTGPRLTVADGLVRLAGLRTPETIVPSAPRLELVPDPLTDEIELPAPEDEAPTDDDVLGEPPSWTPGPVAVPPPPPTLPPPPPPVMPLPPVPPPPVASVWADEATEQIPATPPEPEPEQDWAPPGPVAHLSFSNGTEIDVEGLIVIGRAPDAGRFPVDEEPMLVTVPSPHSEISSTHLEVRPGTGDEHGLAVVTDLGSTNGTLLVQPGQRPEELRSGVPVALQVGAMIDLGDGLTIRVSEA